jgi:hypothetical protein
MQAALPAPPFVPVDVAHSGADLARPVVGRRQRLCRHRWRRRSRCGDHRKSTDRRVLFARDDQKLGHHWGALPTPRHAIQSRCHRSLGDGSLRRHDPVASGHAHAELPLPKRAAHHLRIGRRRSRWMKSIVTWPGGRTQTVDAVELDSLNQVTEP